MIQLLDKETGSLLSSTSEEELKILIDNLEEESEDDTEYYLNRVTLEMLKEKGADQLLIDLLESALGDREDLEIEWSRT